MTDASKRPGLSRPSLAAALDKYDKKDLISLLAHYEAELQAQELALSILKAERTGKIFDYDKHAVADAGGIPTGDAELSLLRDASFELDHRTTDKAAPPLSQTLYRSHIDELENLAAAQRSFSRKANQSINALEKHHAKILREMHLEKERAQNNSLKSDEFFLLVENERNKIQAQLDQKDGEISSLEAQLDASTKSLRAEKDRERLMILYLINERKQLLLRLNEMRMRLNNKNDLEETPMVRELRKQFAGVSNERDSLANTVRGLQSEKDALQRKVRHLEEDLLLIQQNVLHRTKEQTESLDRNTKLDSLILANRGAFASENRQQQPPYYHHTHPAPHQRQTGSQMPQATSTSQYAPHVSVVGTKSVSSATPSVRAHPQKAPLALPQVERTSSSGYYPPTPSTTTAAATGIDSHTYSIGKNPSVSLSNGVPPSNHSTVLLHRSSGRPPLGIKASNLPLSRNTHSQPGVLSNPVAYRPSTTGKINNLPKTNSSGNAGRRPFSSAHLPTSTSFPTSFTTQSQTPFPSSSSSTSSSPSTVSLLHQHAPREEPSYIVDVDSRSPKTLTQRSSSLPRNIVRSVQLNLLHNARKSASNSNNAQQHNW